MTPNSASLRFYLNYRKFDGVIFVALNNADRSENRNRGIKAHPGC